MSPRQEYEQRQLAEALLFGRRVDRAKESALLERRISRCEAAYERLRVGQAMRAAEGGWHGQRNR